MEKQIPTNLMVIYFSIYLGMTIIVYSFISLCFRRGGQLTKFWNHQGETSTTRANAFTLSASDVWCGDGGITLAQHG